jgi:serine/threonine-protein kinase
VIWPDQIPVPLVQYLQQIGQIHAVFDQQDSGNLCYGLTCEGKRYFVKIPGDPADTSPLLTYTQRSNLLINAA